MDEHFRFVKTDAELEDSNLMCAVCQAVLTDPVALNPCGHVFCRRCIEANSRKNTVSGHACPTCRSDVTGQCPIPSIKDQVDSLKIKCTLCDWKGYRQDIPHHLETCQEMPVVCPFADVGCAVKLPRKMILCHCDRSYTRHLLLTKNLLVDTRRVKKPRLQSSDPA